MSALTAAEARERIDRVKGHVDQISEDVLQLWHGLAWQALGYDDWYSMCDAEFEVRIQLPREKRQELVADLSSEGMSTRAIGAAIGVSHPTVLTDLKSGGQDLPPEPETETEPESKTATITTKTKTTDERTVTEVVDTETGEITEQPQPVAKVIGLDGKTYQRKPKPTQPNRKSLIDDFEKSLATVNKSVERLRKHTDDDRWKKNAALISDRNYGDLDRLIKTLAEVINQMEQTQKEATS